jgi:hypothetical protein
MIGYCCSVLGHLLKALCSLGMCRRTPLRAHVSLAFDATITETTHMVHDGCPGETRVRSERREVAGWTVPFLETSERRS